MTTPEPRAAHRLPALGDLGRSGIVGSLDGAGVRIALVCGRFNLDITTLLLDGALAELEHLGVGSTDQAVVWVPGAFELPLAARELARTGHFDAVICLGAVIRGETTHYDFVAGECAAGLQRVQLDSGLPVIFGVLTTENLDQAYARAGGALGNKGTEAVSTAVEMVHVVRHVAMLGEGSRISMGAAKAADAVGEPRLDWPPEPEPEPAPEAGALDDLPGPAGSVV